MQSRRCTALCLCVALAGLVGCAKCQQLPNGGFLALPGIGAELYPEYNIPVRVPLPTLAVLNGSATFHLTATTITVLLPVTICRHIRFSTIAYCTAQIAHIQAEAS